MGDALKTPLYQGNSVSLPSASENGAAAWQNKANRNIATSRPRRSLTAWSLAIWVYRDQKAHIVNAEGLGSPREPRACAGWVELGTTIGGGGYRRVALDPVAEAVSAFVRTLGDDGRVLVRHAVSAQIPDWIPEVRNPLGPEWIVDVDPRTGLPARRSPSNRRGERDPAAVRVLRDPVTRASYCPLMPRYTKSRVDWARQDYRAWWRAVMAVQGHFETRPRELPGIELLPYAPPEAPWLA